MSDCLFCKFAKKDLPKEFVYEDSDVMVFPDIHPIKPVHLLIIPKRHISDFLELEDDELMVEILLIIQKMVKDQHLEDKGYRIVVNGGGAQIINHLHFHLTGPWGKAAEL
ncbi:MAG TPA: HIT domain-containing protein [Candidatus Saccharimonadales bacterium]|nr:HIT domain-containing protein [Candidatus Saccharimonadales bacterium]